jgi:ribose-phosphate pyrophosphokinase
MNIIGDVEGRTCVIMDDIVDTANTLCKAATALKEHGAKKVVAYCTHAGAVGRRGPAHRDLRARRDRRLRHDSADRGGEACSRIRILSCAQLLAETMTRVSNEESVSSLFTE